MSKLVIAEVAIGNNQRQMVSKKILKAVMAIGFIMLVIISCYAAMPVYTETKKYINQNNVSNQMILNMLQQYTVYIAIFSIIVVAVALLIKGFGSVTTIQKKVLKVIKYYVISFCISFIGILLGVTISLSPLNNYKLNIGTIVYAILLITLLLMSILSSDTINNAKKFICKK